MVKNLSLIAVFSLGAFLVPAIAANAPELTACGIVTGADAQKFIGGPLDVKESAKVPAADGTTSYKSICTYLGRGENFQDMLTASRVLDITLHFLDTAEASAQMYDNTLDQYRLRINSPDLPFTNATFTPINGFGDKAFVFYKGRVAGSVSAWNKPASSVETTQTVLRYILGKLPQ
ncbi:MAG: hypothetical protein E6J73_03120 [Deltaproteobacteria bacterium]|nr:MAG: hypothetical protein E6J73_03120 [Deltaproteobacteria bacterium]